MMIPNDDRGQQAIRARAYRLAESGLFTNSHAVEQALVAEGWPNAALVLQGDYARKAVGERCRMAKAH